MIEYACPVACRALPKQARRWIPRASVTVQSPAPIGRVSEHDPHRLAHGAREMRNRGVRRDDEINERNHGGCVAKIPELRPEMKHVAMLAERDDIALADAWIEAVENNIRGREQRRYFRERKGTPVVMLVGGVTTPYQADARKRRLRQPPCPFCGQRVVRIDVRNACRNGLGRRAERQRETEQRTLQIDGREPLVL